MNTRILQILMVLILLVPTAVFAGDDDILGVWNNQEKSAKIELFKCGDKYCGKLVELTEPNYPEGSREGVPGTPKLDNNNPDPNLRKTPRLGLAILRDFAHAGENKWAGGKVYDPKNGKTYSGKMTLVTPGQLEMRGFLGISLLGRTATWTRVNL
ncbi:MAG: DUF2147 domain-containing protein [Nitrospirae bacterium]|nr:DUF2147 domain-containing protein [Nitrospirota bacterium]